MLRSTMCVSMLSSALGAIVQAEISASKSGLAKERVDGGIYDNSSATVDVESPEEKLPLPISAEGCNHPRISCHITDLVLLKPMLYVLSARKAGLMSLVGAELRGMKTKYTGKGIERLTAELLEKIPQGKPITFRDITQPIDPDTEVLDIQFAAGTTAIETMDDSLSIIYFKRISAPDDFMKFSNDLVEAIGTVSQTATIDTIMYDALIRHKAEPSFIRKVAKAPVARGGKNFLDSLFHASKKYEGNPYPKLMELLTDPGLYKAKKKHHKSKKVAEQFQMEKMQREFEEESAMRAADLREELRRENQEREDEIGAMMETIPQELPTVAEGSLYSSMI